MLTSPERSLLDTSYKVYDRVDHKRLGALQTRVRLLGTKNREFEEKTTWWVRREGTNKRHESWDHDRAEAKLLSHPHPKQSPGRPG